MTKAPLKVVVDYEELGITPYELDRIVLEKHTVFKDQKLDYLAYAEALIKEAANHVRGNKQ